MQTPGQSLVLRNKSKPLYSFSNFSGFRADAKPSEVAASPDDSRRRNNEVFPVCWSRLVWETWRCNEEVLLIVGNNCVFVKRVWVDGRVCRGSLTTGFVCPASRSHRKETVAPERRDTAAAASQLRLCHFLRRRPRPPHPLPVASQARGEGKEADLFQDGHNSGWG